MIGGAADSAGEWIELILPNAIREGIAEIEPVAFAIPNHRVRDTDLSLPTRDPAVRINPVQSAIRAPGFSLGSVGIHIVAHRAGPQRSAGIDSGIIQADSGPTREPESLVAP